jgi:hypothetical protein
MATLTAESPVTGLPSLSLVAPSGARVGAFTVHRSRAARWRSPPAT